MQVKIKKLHPSAVVPNYAKPGDAAVDLIAVSEEYDPIKGQVVYDTGLAFEIPEGYVGLVFPRSSICKKTMSLCNSVGVIDSGYRGSVKAFFWAPDPKETYKVGERIAQIMIVPYPQIEFIEAEELSTTERGTGGIGSTGA